MASSIIETNPTSGTATTASVRANFLAAKTEIEALQDDKAPLAAPALTGSATAVNLTVSGTLDAAGTLEVGGVALTATAAELNYMDGVTSNVQTQLDAKIESNETITLSGDATGSGTTAITVTVPEAAVTQHEAAIDAGSVDGYDIVVDSGSPSGTDANTIYFVT